MHVFSQVFAAVLRVEMVDLVFRLALTPTCANVAVGFLAPSVRSTPIPVPQAPASMGVSFPDKKIWSYQASAHSHAVVVIVNFRLLKRPLKE